MNIFEAERILRARAIAALRRTIGGSRFLIAGSIALTLLVLGPIVSAGFSGDDVYRTHLTAYAALRRLDLAHAIARAGGQWARERGGFFPLQSVVFAFWATDPKPGFALFGQLCLIGCNVATFGVLIRRLTKSAVSGWLAVSAFFLTLELRVADDAVLGPLFITPLTLECLLGALLAWTSYAGSRGQRWLFVSFLLYAGATLGDAWAYPAAACFIGLAFMQLRRRSALLVACAYACIPAAALAYGAAKGNGFPAAFAGQDGVRPFLERAVSALPTFYRATGALVRDGVSNFDGDRRFIAVPVAGAKGWLIACVIALIVLGCLRLLENRRRSASRARYAALVAGTLWISPALISDRLCAYPMYFGVALALALTLGCLRERISQRMPAQGDAFAVGVALVALFVMYGNVRFNTYVLFRHRTADLVRQHIQEAAAARLFVRLPAHATLAVQRDYPFYIGTGDYRDAENLFYHYTHRFYRVSAAPEIEESGAVPADTWYLRLNAPQQTLLNPSVVAAHWSRTAKQTIFTDEALGYRQYVNEAETNAAWDLFARPERGLHWASNDVDGRGVLVHAVRRCGPVPVQAAFLSNAPRIVWDGGFYAPESTPRALMANAIAYTYAPYSAQTQTPRRFAGPRARIFIERDACEEGALRLQMSVYTDAPAHLTVRLGSHAERYFLSQGTEDLNLLIPKSVPKRFDVVLQTDAPLVPEISEIPRYAHTGAQDIRMLVVNPVAVPL